MPPDYDILLGDHTGLQGYRVRSFVRDSAPLIAPKFSTGAQSQTDLDLLKSKSVDNFSGGMFQREWEESTKAARVYGVYNRYDNNLYPAPALAAPTFSSGSAPTSGTIVAKIESNSMSFIARSFYSAGTYYNSLYKITAYSNSITPITLPAAIATSTLSPITSLTLHKGYLYVMGKISPAGYWNAQKMDLNTGTFSATGVNGVHFAVLRGSLYILGLSGGVWLCTNETTTSATVTLIDQVSFSDGQLDTFLAFQEFNGALYISLSDGLYRFDGVKATKILSLSPTVMKAFNGALYFYANKWLYRFDGSNLEQIQFFGEETVTGFSATQANLYMATSIIAGSYSLDSKPTSSTDVTLRLYAHDGAAFYIYNERDITTGINTPTLTPFSCTDAQVHLIWHRYSDSFTTTDMEWKYANQAAKGALEFTVSDFDDGFPNILKSLEHVRPLYSNKDIDDRITIKSQYYDGATWQTWQTLTTNATGQIEVNNPFNKLFLKFRLHVSVSTLQSDSTISFKGAVFGYTLQPRMRWRWQTILMAEGNGSIETRNNVAINSDSNELSNVITKAIKLKTPLFLAAPDYARVNLAANNSALSIRVGGQLPIYTDPYGEPIFMAVKNASNVWEILKVASVTYDSLNDQTTIAITERGYHGITAGSISLDAEIRILHKVYITRLLREAPELHENIYAQDITTKESQIKREYSIEITEV